MWAPPGLVLPSLGLKLLGPPARRRADRAFEANDDAARGRPTSFAHGAKRAPRPSSWKPLLYPAEACCSHGLRAACVEMQPQDAASAHTAGACHSCSAPGSGEREPMAAIHSSRCWNPQNRLSRMGCARCRAARLAAIGGSMARGGEKPRLPPRPRRRFRACARPCQPANAAAAENRRCWLQGMGSARRGGEIWPR